MPALPKYMIAYNRELDGPMIICTRAPYLAGKVWKFKDHLEYISFFNTYTGLGIGTVTGYKMAVTFYGVVTGTKMQTTNPGITAEIRRTMQEMADFFKTEMIEDNPARYKKFLLVE